MWSAALANAGLRVRLKIHQKLASANPPKRVALLGGSFNPAHDGHRHISLAALRRLRVDQVWWMVSPQNPLKPVAGMAPLDERMASAQEAARHPQIKITDIERHLGTLYTADTLAALTRRFPQTRFVWLMGADNLAQMSQWKDWNRIFRLVNIAVYDRPGYGLKALGSKVAQRFAKDRLGEAKAASLVKTEPPAWVFLHGVLHPASSTHIRAMRKSVIG